MVNIIQAINDSVQTELEMIVSYYINEGTIQKAPWPSANCQALSQVWPVWGLFKVGESGGGEVEWGRG